MLDLNKLACSSKLCAWRKSQTHANRAPLSAINFRRPRKNDLAPSVSNDEVNIRSYSSWDPRKLSELLRNILIKLKEIARKAAVPNNLSIFDDIQLNSGTDTAGEDETTCISEPLVSPFESRNINFNERELKNYSKNVFITI